MPRGWRVDGATGDNYMEQLGEVLKGSPERTKDYLHRCVVTMLETKARWKQVQGNPKQHPDHKTQDEENQEASLPEGPDFPNTLHYYPLTHTH